MDVLERLLDAGTTSRMGVPIQQVLDQARLYPALLVQTAVGIAATRRRREALLIKLATEVMGTVRAGIEMRLPACQVIHPYRVLDKDWVLNLPQWTGGTWTYPLSHLLKAEVRALFEDSIPENNDYAEIFHGYEFRMSLLHETTNATYSGGYRAMSGEYVGERGWSCEDRNVAIAEIAFRETGQRAADWAWFRVLGGEDAYDQALIDHRAVLENFKYRNMR
jgi:hypothetical protein